MASANACAAGLSARQRDAVVGEQGLDVALYRPQTLRVCEEHGGQLIRQLAWFRLGPGTQELVNEIGWHV